ncbi:pentatricopeptide repeat-containing protein [Senna tora]|uniref:Pentatricopeptide repeat-containing protein n=1 Tax=Senna tora TaxID=362788 RepID=A0A834WGG1_9FABA|nr:pentatricopeptide repeat-containing protein [Senna tora]
MSSRRASLLRISSLTRLHSKSSSCNIVDSFKIVNTLKTISTSAERSEFQLPSTCHPDYSINYQQNHTKCYPESQSNKYSRSGIYGGSSVDNQQSLNHDRCYTEGLQNDFANKLTEHGSNFSWFYGQNNNIPERTSDGRNLNSSRNVFQKNWVGHNGNVDGNHGQSNTDMQQNRNGIGVNNSREFLKHPNASVENQDGYYRPTERGHYSNPYSSQILSESQRNLKGNPLQNLNHSQQASNDHVPWSNNMNNQYNPGSGQFLQNLIDCQYPPNTKTVQSSMIGSHLSNNAKSMEELAEADDGSPYSGTLEELDKFCMEGKVKEAVEVLGLLEKKNMPVDFSRYLQLMHQCGEAKALEEAKIIHEHVIRNLSPLKVSTYNRILEMYSKCGSMDDAFKVFNNMPNRNLTTWDTMITWLAKNGFAEDSIDVFAQFKKMGQKPDGQMFIGVFAACSMLGDIDEGILHFESMSKNYGIVPSMVHYVSVVDMFGSIGHLDEAFQFVENMPVEPSADVWETLMNLCRIHGNMELGDRCAELVEQLDPSRLNEQSKAGLVPVKNSDLVKEKEKKKLANQNLLEVRSRVHEYRAGDTSHPENDKIYGLLRGLKSQMKEAGYIPETRFVLHDIDQEGKEEALLAHSERLAVAYGLLSSSVRSPIRIIKNLRVCGDCHTALKIISKIVGRELIIRDAKRFHHFKDGLCSCRDYW